MGWVDLTISDLFGSTLIWVGHMQSIKFGLIPNPIDN